MSFPADMVGPNVRYFERDLPGLVVRMQKVGSLDLWLAMKRTADAITWDSRLTGETEGERAERRATMKVAFTTKREAWLASLATTRPGGCAMRAGAVIDAVRYRRMRRPQFTHQRRLPASPVGAGCRERRQLQRSRHTVCRRRRMRPHGSTGGTMGGRNASPQPNAPPIAKQSARPSAADMGELSGDTSVKNLQLIENIVVQQGIQTLLPPCRGGEPSSI
jgi:hypothetical protein